jgi:hypothetical protein
MDWALSGRLVRMVVCVVMVEMSVATAEGSGSRARRWGASDYVVGGRPVDLDAQQGLKGGGVEGEVGVVGGRGGGGSGVGFLRTLVLFWHRQLGSEDVNLERPHEAGRPPPADKPPRHAAGDGESDARYDCRCTPIS